MLAMGLVFSGERPKEVRITDKDIIIQRIFSPDSAKVIIFYAYDEGAFGHSPFHTAIVDFKDTLTDLTKHEVANKDLLLYPFQWIDNRTIVISPDTTSINRTFTSRREILLEGIKFIYQKE
jgi:hypothetical protein